ncbi:MAG: hypothetical protein HY518_04240 [Candidatus Aenigmarchaeota archaeon]|nr:hypothetical protein [Candidatus Aenigmarchaeota archaeon]
MERHLKLSQDGRGPCSGAHTADHGKGKHGICAPEAFYELKDEGLDVAVFEDFSSLLTGSYTLDQLESYDI